jgi:SAM-dependent methyltransferase|uniref:SAM-dependent methyltransferase n=1 Tax=Desulfobacca acetoxidans TaxID=60893 RepID=A0A7V6A327_9BACT
MNLKILEVLVKGLATYVPGYQRVLDKLGYSCPGGTITSEYCLSVWLQHMELARQHGLSSTPEVVAEIGPGNSLGVGLCALLTGSRVYYAFDIQAYSNTARNLQIFSEIIGLLKMKRARLQGSQLPGHILTAERLDRDLEPRRLDQIRQCILRENQPVHGMYLGYMVPWDNPATLEENSVDFILSHAVMEHVDDPERVYRILYRWLKPGGCMSHMIDYRCHNLAWRWNGHWSYSEPLWKLMRSKRPYFINRHSHSEHAAMMRRCGFRIVGELKTTDVSGIPRQELDDRFQGLSDEDLITATGYFQAVKPQD